MSRADTDNGSTWGRSLFVLLRLLVVAFALQALGENPVNQGWVLFMILVSAGVLFPFSRPLQGLRSMPLLEVHQWNMTVLMFLGFIRPPGREAAVFAGCWFFWCCFMAWGSWQNLRKSNSFQLGNLCVAVSGIFPTIGAAWLVAHRAGWTPLDFDPLIVLLTAAHFHHAGFTLPLMAGLNAKARPGRLIQWSCVAILVGVPLVAAGITCTHFGALPFVEPFGVAILVLGALGVAVSQIQRGLERDCRGITRVGFWVSGVSLFAAMLLALSFGLRFVFPQFALTMPQMWAIHGTLNAFGFGLCGILAWRSKAAQI